MTPWQRLGRKLEKQATQWMPPALRRSVLTLLARDRPKRAIDVREDDAFIVSYPKSGNTWVRFLVANLLYPDPTDFETLETRVPTIYKNTRRELDSFPSPRVLKSHEYFDPRYRRVVYLVRDPRDVVISYFHYSLRKGSIAMGHSLTDFAADFLAGKMGNVGSWQENVASWLAARDGSPNFLLVHYEHLRARPVDEATRIARFLNCASDQVSIQRAVAASSFERMRELEKASGSTLQLKKKGADIPFVRKGRVGGWREELPDDVRVAIEAAWGPLMQRLGYL